MHISLYDRKKALSLLKEILVKLLAEYEKEKINGRGALEEVKKIIMTSQEELTEGYVTDLLDYKNSTTRESSINKLNYSINNLSEKQKEIIKRHYIDGKSYEMIAKELSKKPGALRTMACRTMQKLKDELAL
jgi:RNA polymerase sigma factor (sigma-70 family)